MDIVRGKNMKGYKLDDSRLARMFKEDKEKWKAKALLRQEEKRKMAIAIRDLRLSREKWRERAKIFEEDLMELETELAETKAELAATKAEINELKKKAFTIDRTANKLPLNFNPDLIM